MATIKHKRGSGDPSTSDVAVGELAINTTDGGVFTKTDGGSVVEVGASSGGGVTVQEEGSSLSTTATTLNFVGSNVTASGTGATKTITVSGSSGGLSSDAQYNTVGGSNAGDSFSGTNAQNNTLLGYNSGTNITTATQSTFVGANAGETHTAGSNLSLIHI